MTELVLAAMVIQRVTLTPAPGQEEPVPVAGMSLRPANGLRLVAADR